MPGHVVRDDLALGPDPLNAETVLRRDQTTGRIVTDEALGWMTSFAAAEAAGMALKIPLEAHEVEGLDRLIVIGVRTAGGAEEGAACVARVLEGHRFGAGLAFVPQGAPTNNTHVAPAGFTSATEEVSDAIWDAQETPPNEETERLKKTDGQRAAEALGIPFASTAALPNAAQRDVAEALAMNDALWAGTLGTFLGDVLHPLLSDAMMGRLRRYFTSFVIGRGMAPAIRVANQPYGVLVTSAFARWRWNEAETGRDGGFWNGLTGMLAALERRWRALVPETAWVGKPAADPFPNLLAIIGLQASSVTFGRRMGLHDEFLWNYLVFQSGPVSVAAALDDALTSAKRENLMRLRQTLPELPASLRTVTFLGTSDPMNGPVIDGDPDVPLSEQAGIRPFDGARNYIDWLAASTRTEILGQSFTNAEGQAVAAPSALLYRLLRHSCLTELGRASQQLAQNRAPAIFADLPREPVIANMSPATQSFSRLHLMNVDAGRIGVVDTRRTAVGDFLMAEAHSLGDLVSRAPEAMNLAGTIAALRVLAGMPTARLERCLAEHLDLCSYRLDAWIQGLFARRLDWLREQRRTGTYVGAFGWLENLRPTASPPVVVPHDSLHDSLAAELSAADEIVEYDDNGGYIHAPSLGHAATAAVLRNGYLTHAGAPDAQTLAVNLSSARVRTAMSLVDGLRNGQELAALLGYQLERGLHENAAGAELDQYIYVLRDRFPFVSNKLTAVPAGKSAELVEARNVVNGYDLLQYVRTHPAYLDEIAGLPTDPAKRQALAAEVKAVGDAMDALGDLVLAESVHQVMQGNYDRANGMLQTATDGAVPPDIEVITTPRSGRSITHRLALHLNPGQTSGWHTPLSPRAGANAPLNHWLREQLPAPADVQWKVSFAGVDEFVGLDQLGLEPIDVVAMAGGRLGDQSSELERWLVYSYRQTRAVPDNVVSFSPTTIDPDVPPARRLLFDVGAASPGKRPLADLLPLLAALGALMAHARPLDAQDHVVPAEAANLPVDNPNGWDDGAAPLQDVSELKARIELAFSALDTIVATGLGPLLTATVTPLYEAFRQDPLHAVAPAWSGHLTTIRGHLESIARFGIVEALPAARFEVAAATIDSLVPHAEAIVKMLTPRLAAARGSLDVVFTDPLPADAGKAAFERARRTRVRVESYTEAARALLGRAFTPLPLFRISAPQRAELTAAVATPIVSDRAAIGRWVDSLVRVREAVAAVSWLHTLRDWFGLPPAAVQPVQLPVRSGDRWIGVEFGSHLQPGDVLSIALLALPPPFSGLQTGLLLDDWTELVPNSKETTGIAVHANRPNAVAPQALLLVVPPELRGTWSWDHLVDSLVDTLDRARLRAVEPDQIAETEFFQLLPMLLTEFGTGSTLVSTAFSESVMATVSALRI